MNEPESVRVVIADDEPLACRRISRMLRAHLDVEIMEVCRDGHEALEAIQKHNPDLLFLDIQMPNMDGFRLLKSLKQEELPHVIFVTAYDQYAVDAFEVHAVDYLLKPFNRSRLDAALEHARDQISRNKTRNLDPGLIGILDEMNMQPRYRENLMLRVQGRVLFIKMKDIDWVEAEGKYVHIHTGQQSHLVRQQMNALEAELNPNRFARIHKSTIVNVERIHHLEELFHGDYRVVMVDGTQLTVSRRYRQNLHRILGKFL